jgi:hypothetical protein
MTGEKPIKPIQIRAGYPVRTKHLSVSGAAVTMGRPCKDGHPELELATNKIFLKKYY